MALPRRLPPWTLLPPGVEWAGCDLPRWTTAPDADNTVGTPSTPPAESFRLRFLVKIGFQPELLAFDGADVYTPAERFFGLDSPANSALRKLPVELLSCCRPRPACMKFAAMWCKQNCDCKDQQHTIDHHPVNELATT
jgi:hypothetical protein